MAVLSHHYRSRRARAAAYRSSQWLLHISVLAVALAVVLANVIR